MFPGLVDLRLERLVATSKAGKDRVAGQDEDQGVGEEGYEDQERYRLEKAPYDVALQVKGRLSVGGSES